MDGRECLLIDQRIKSESKDSIIGLDRFRLTAKRNHLTAHFLAGNVCP